MAIETAKVVLMKSDPLDILRAITLSQATVRKMKQNLGLGLGLRPEWSALLMSLSLIIVAVNAVLLKRVESKVSAPASAAPPAAAGLAPVVR